jgi:hypothetical protein
VATTQTGNFERGIPTVALIALTGGQIVAGALPLKQLAACLLAREWQRKCCAQ